jgi:hypothetical protein
MPNDANSSLGLGEERVPAGEAGAIAELTAIHLNLMKSAPDRRGPHRKHQGCVLAHFDVRDDVPADLRVGLFAAPTQFLAVIRYSNGGGVDDRLPDAHAMAIKLVGVPGPKLVDQDATTVDFVVCDHPVFIVKDVDEMVRFEQAKARRIAFTGTDDEFAAQFPDDAALLHRFAQSGFLKPPANSPFESNYWSQTPSALGDGRAVKYVARASPANAAPPVPRTEDFLRDAMVDQLVVRHTPAFFDFCVDVQTDAVRMPVEDPMVPWADDVQTAIPLARIEVLPLPFDTTEIMQFCEALSYNPWHAMLAHRPLGGINRARAAIYVATSVARHGASGAARAEPTEADVRRLWNVDGTPPNG